MSVDESGHVSCLYVDICLVRFPCFFHCIQLENDDNESVRKGDGRNEIRDNRNRLQRETVQGNSHGQLEICNGAQYIQWYVMGSRNRRKANENQGMVQLESREMV